MSSGRVRSNADIKESSGNPDKHGVVFVIKKAYIP